MYGSGWNTCRTCRRNGGTSINSPSLPGYEEFIAQLEETGEPRIFVLPVEKAKLIDNWDVMGLRGTGSIDYEIEDGIRRPIACMIADEEHAIHAFIDPLHHRKGRG